MALRPVALLWDVDGTLAETEDQGHRPAFNQAFRDAGLPWHWDSQLYRRLLAVSGGRERLARFLKDVEGRTPDAELLDELVERKQFHYMRLVRQGCCALRPGVSRLLHEAAASGLPQAVVTTSSRRAVEALAEGVLGELRQVFAFWICGEDVAIKKPDPSAYTQAVERMALPASALLAIEDSPQGLAAASAAGASGAPRLRFQKRQKCRVFHAPQPGERLSPRRQAGNAPAKFAVDAGAQFRALPARPVERPALAAGGVQWQQ